MDDNRLVKLIDGETWIGLDIDIKGEIYEGLLEKNAQDTNVPVNSPKIAFE